MGWNRARGIDGGKREPGRRDACGVWVGLGGERKVGVEDGTPGGGGAGGVVLQGAAEAEHGLAADGESETETETAVGQRDEALEQTGLDGGREPGAIVADGEADAVVDGGGGDADPARPRMFGEGVTRVEAEIEDDLADEAGVGGER